MNAHGEEPPQPTTALGVPRLDPTVLPQDEEPPVAEPATQRNHPLSISQKLWNAAYNDLEGADGTAGLVQSYTEALTKVLGVNLDITDLEDPDKRQIYMKELVEEGKAKVAEASKITKRVGDFATAILSVKPMVDLAINNIPQAAPAAIPWAGVCAGLQVSHPP
jgi:hypothetical protein